MRWTLEPTMPKLEPCNVTVPVVDTCARPPMAPSPPTMATEPPAASLLLCPPPTDAPLPVPELLPADTRTSPALPSALPDCRRNEPDVPPFAVPLDTVIVPLCAGAADVVRSTDPLPVPALTPLFSTKLPPTFDVLEPAFIATLPALLVLEPPASVTARPVILALPLALPLMPACSRTSPLVLDSAAGAVAVEPPCQENCSNVSEQGAC